MAKAKTTAMTEAKGKTAKGAKPAPKAAAKVSATPSPKSKTPAKPKPTPKAKPKTQTTPAAAKAPANRDRAIRERAALLKQLSDPTRLRVVHILEQGEQSVGAICKQLATNQPAVSHHLSLLRHGGIVIPRRDGKSNLYSLTETGRQLATLVKTLID